MICPQCQYQDTRVIDSRVIEEGHVIRRRRECEKCEFRFTTFERKSLGELVVIKRSGAKEYYDREKLIRAIMLAFAKRKVALDEIQSVVTQLENKRLQGNSEITSEKIGMDVLIALKDIDLVAYIRFASVYMDFDTLEDFQKLV